ARREPARYRAGGAGPVVTARRGSGAEDDRARGGEPATRAVDARELRVLDLASVRLAPKLARRLDEQEHAAHAGMAVRQPAAVGVRRQRSPEAELAVLDEGAAFARLAEPERLDAGQHHVGERVLDLTGVDVGRLHASPFERELAAGVGRGASEVVPLA